MSTWDAAPSESRWYGEIIFGGEDWTEYNYGFSSSVTRPSYASLSEMKPDGAKILERTIRMSRGHPRFKASEEED
jgi:hypothetical protein